MSEIAVVICTYDNPVMLDRVLGTLSARTAVGGRWSVLVVDNNSGRETQQVLDRHLARSSAPGLRVVVETTQGLTPARLRGVAETTAPWVAFVDDDCMVEPDWVERALAFAALHPDCGGFGGRVVPTYEEPPPPAVAARGWLFAEQDLGLEAVTVECLVGAGIVLNRSALVESGWTDGPYFADRIGSNLVSGGDVEIALRVAGTGRPLWYEPSCRLRHIIPAQRTTMGYLHRLTRGLGVSSSLATALTWRGGRRSWVLASVGEAVRALIGVLAGARRTVGSHDGRADLALAATFEWGRWLGTTRFAVLLARGRCPFFGGDRVVPAA